MAEYTMTQIMESMPRYFKPEAAQGLNSTIQFHLTGAEGGDWIVEIKDGTCTVTPGNAANPSMTLTADAQDYKDIVTGKSNPMTAFMQGKVKLAGDLALAMKLSNMFKVT